jgi:hypothetical protein
LGVNLLPGGRAMQKEKGSSIGEEGKSIDRRAVVAAGTYTMFLF